MVHFKPICICQYIQFELGSLGSHGALSFKLMEGSLFSQTLGSVRRWIETRFKASCEMECQEGSIDCYMIIIG